MKFSRKMVSLFTRLQIVTENFFDFKQKSDLLQKSINLYHITDSSFKHKKTNKRFLIVAFYSNQTILIYSQSTAFSHRGVKYSNMTLSKCQFDKKFNFVAVVSGIVVTSINRSSHPKVLCKKVFQKICKIQTKTPVLQSLLIRQQVRPATLLKSGCSKVVFLRILQKIAF